MDNNKFKLEVRCNNLLNKIKKDFPILKNVKIILKIGKLKIGSMWASKTPFHYGITVDFDKYKDANDKQIIGALAHELMHFETYEIHGWKRYFLEYLAFYFSKNLMMKFERENDINTIKRGYGKELLATRIYRFSKISKKEFKQIGLCYLSPNEIKQHIKKIGK
jgi:hypothetical protein